VEEAQDIEEAGHVEEAEEAVDVEGRRKMRRRPCIWRRSQLFAMARHHRMHQG
jgi:hypothetical protein